MTWILALSLRSDWMTIFVSYVDGSDEDLGRNQTVASAAFLLLLMFQFCSICFDPQVLCKHLSNAHV